MDNGKNTLNLYVNYIYESVSLEKCQGFRDGSDNGIISQVSATQLLCFRIDFQYLASVSVEVRVDIQYSGISPAG